MEWEYSELSENLIKSKASQWKVSNLLANLLLNKGFVEKDEVESFLNPNISKLRNPFGFEKMDEVVE
ncbi:MAG: single-stranded-DNA-specific exonuclease RecJ, partial [Cetobacterium sp.]